MSRSRLSALKWKVLSRFARIRLMKVKGMRSCWSRKKVFFLILDEAPDRATRMSRASTVVSRIQLMSTMPPFSWRLTTLRMKPACIV